MKKIIFLLIVAVVAAPWVAWRTHSDTRAEIVIVDQSVDSPAADTHASLVWLLDQQRIRSPRHGAYTLMDYFGYYPERTEKVTRFSYQDISGAGLVYLADTRGVWRSGLETFEMMRDRDRDEWLHSGLSRTEVRALQDYAMTGRPLFAEAFLFYSRHEGGQDAVNRLQDTFGVEWTGWIGGWFINLNNIEEVPFWVRGMYERTQLQQWPYRGPGVIFIRPYTGDFLVLTPGIELRSPRPEITITRRQGILSEGVETNIPIQGWFEVVEALSTDMISAALRIQLTAAGEQRLEEAGLPTSFPLLVTQTVDRKTWYLAADMGTDPTWLGPSRMKWAPDLRGSVTSLFGSHWPGDLAFWKFYVPMISNLLATVAH